MKQYTVNLIMDEVWESGIEIERTEVFKVTIGRLWLHAGICCEIGSWELLLKEKVEA